MLRSRWFRLLALLFAFSLVAAACGDDDDSSSESETSGTSETADTADTEETADTEDTEETADTEDTEAMADTEDTGAMADATPVKTCLVTDLAGVDDQSFNASAWQGVQDAIDAGYATEDSTFLESDAAEDWQPNIDQFLSQDCEHIVTVGFALGEVTDLNAAENPDVNWTMVDNILATQHDNVSQLVYQTDEAAFLAGYLAAGMTQTGVIGTYGGDNFPTVSIFMDGYTRGAQYYNEVKGTDVEVKGWDVDAQDGVFTGSFTDLALARSTAESLFDEDVDMIIPVGGAINLPAGDAITERGLDAALIGVDQDAFNAMDPQYQDLWLTTVEKNLAGYVTDSVAADATGAFGAGFVVGSLENDGVGLAPFHSWEDRVPAELVTELEEVEAAIIAGEIEAAFTDPTGGA